MNHEAVEYARGISVVKTFGQSIFSFKKFHGVIEQYKELAVTYTLHCRVPMVTFQTLLTTASLFMVIGSVILFSFAENPQSFFLDVLFFLFTTPFLAI